MPIIPPSMIHGQQRGAKRNDTIDVRYHGRLDHRTSLPISTVVQIFGRGDTYLLSPFTVDTVVPGYKVLVPDLPGHRLQLSGL